MVKPVVQEHNAPEAVQCHLLQKCHKYEKGLEAMILRY